MALGPFIPFLAVALIASVTGMVHGAGRNDPEFTRFAAVGFIVVVCALALYVNAYAWRQKNDEPESIAYSVRRNAHLAALVYAWGASAMFAVYSLSDLAWRHAWQYGLGMTLIGLGIMAYVHKLGETALPPAMLTVFHGLAAAGGLAFLIGTGKLQTVKSDWAANEVFLWGGISIVVLCAISLITQARSNRTG